jgi:uncharacterized protein
MTELTTRSVYFSDPGEASTLRTLELAARRAGELGIETLLIATTSGETGVKAIHVLPNFDLVLVSHSYGFSKPDEQELTEENRRLIENSNARLLTCTHTFGGVGRAVRKKFATYELEELIASTLRLFGQGMKVAVEMALMAADAGLVRTDTPVVSVAGTGSGADTAVVLIPSHAQNFFDLRVLEVICMPA